MSMYALKDTTLTALGDAVRSKVNEMGELNIIKGENVIIQDDKVHSIIFPNDVKTMVILIRLHSQVSDNGYFNLAYAPNVFDNNSTGCDQLRKASGSAMFTDFHGEERRYTISVNSNKISITTNEFKLYRDHLTIDYEAFGFNAYSECWTYNSLGNTYTPLEMSEVIKELDVLPAEALYVTGSCNYRFANDGYNWLINKYGDKIKTANIPNASYMFYGSFYLAEIPFEINLSDNANKESMFVNCQELKYIPKINVKHTSHGTFSNMFNACYRIREIPEWFVDLLEQDQKITANNTAFGPWSNLFKACYSLRTIPDRAMKAIKNPQPSGNYYTAVYSKPFQECMCLDSLNNVACEDISFTSNQFSNFFDGLCRAKDITFETNEDGSPLVRQWKSQTINMCATIGYAASTKKILDYNSGITADKEVKDDATYQALKNDPDWFSCDMRYSRYNHDSAVNTINSLPDCSATGTNTIKFTGLYGELTDGGAIKTLTEEEIAVAAAKGWTVTFA